MACIQFRKFGTKTTGGCFAVPVVWGKQLELPLFSLKHGDVKEGYTFYALVEEDVKGKKHITAQYLTCELGAPVLAAVTGEQFKKWMKAAAILAKPAVFKWSSKPLVWKDVYHLDTKADLL